jgi:hypothetical protein
VKNIIESKLKKQETMPPLFLNSIFSLFFKSNFHLNRSIHQLNKNCKQIHLKQNGEIRKEKEITKNKLQNKAREKEKKRERGPWPSSEEEPASQSKQDDEPITVVYRPASQRVQEGAAVCLFVLKKSRG